MAGLTSLIADEQLFQVLKEIDLLPQLYEQYLVSRERVVISLPYRKYSRSLSFHLFTVISEFYCGFLYYTPSLRNCSFCLERHDRNYLCLPGYFEESSIELLAAMLRWQRVPYFSLIDLASFVRLCGYLMIKTNVVHAFLTRLLPSSLYAVDFAGSAHIFAYELHRNGFFGTAEYFSRFVDHPRFYSLLQQYPSYRNVKRKLRSFHRYRSFAKPYTRIPLHSGELKEGRREIKE
jgi:hypothetical protein